MDLVLDDTLLLLGATVALIFVFLCICVVCDRHLVPAVETIIEEFDVPEEIAAVTLIAFGSSSPEILLNTVSAFEGSGALSMPAMLGSAIIAFGLIPPLCVLSTSQENVDLETRPILRETFCFTMGLCVFTKIVGDGSASLTESLLILGMYIVYVLIIIITYYCYKNSEHIPHQPPLASNITLSPEIQDDEESKPLVEVVVSMGLIEDNQPESSTTSSKKSDNIGSENDGTGYVQREYSKHSLVHCGHRVFSCLANPFVMFFHFSIPSLEDAVVCVGDRGLARQFPSPLSYSETIKASASTSAPTVQFGHSPFCCHAHKVTLFRALTVVATSIAYVCVFASVVVALCGVITQHIGLDQTTIGATLVAFGAQLPDIVSSISLARGGYFNGAMANAIGSQVINITLGVGLPASVLCLYSTSKTFEIVQRSDNSIKFLVGLSFIVIVGYCLFTLPLVSLFRYGTVQKSTSINRRGAYGQLLLFVIVMVVYVTFND